MITTNAIVNPGSGTRVDDRQVRGASDKSAQVCSSPCSASPEDAPSVDKRSRTISRILAPLFAMSLLAFAPGCTGAPGEVDPGQDDPPGGHEEGCPPQPDKFCFDACRCVDPPAITDIVAIAAGGDHTCGLTSKGGVRCWGAGARGQLGAGSDIIGALVPREVVGLGAGVASIAAYSNSTYALTTAGSVFGWGEDAERAEIDGAPADPFVPSPVHGLDSGVRMISSKTETCAVTVSSQILCWDYYDYLVPQTVSDIPPGVHTVAAGIDHSCAINDEGGVVCWGRNQSGQRGDGTRFDSHLPNAVSGLDSGVVGIAVDGASACGSSCAVMDTGALMCWGAPKQWCRVDMDPSDFRLIPVEVLDSSWGVRAISFGGWHTCILTKAGGALCWGRNEYGQLGDGTTEERDEPTQVFGLESGVKSISAGPDHTCAVMEAGGAKCWGSNHRGQLGDYSRASIQTKPVDVIGFE